MHWNQWSAACAQLVRHWERSGIQQFPSSTPQSTTRATDWLDENAAVLDEGALLEDAPQTTSSVEMALEQPATAVAAVLSPRNLSPVPTAATSTSSSPAFVTKGDGKWNSRSMSVEDRHRAFSSLNDKVVACRNCEEIVCRRQRTVFGVGAINARVVMFGEAPGGEEDRVGEPFVGPAGQLLDKILVASGLKRSEVYIVNALKCRPPSNRTPTDAEIENCRPFFEAQLETIQPEYIVCWGSVAVRAVLGSTDSVGRLRGKFHDYRGAKVMVTYHPAYLLRNPDAKKLTWEDMKMLMKEMGVAIPARN